MFGDLSKLPPELRDATVSAHLAYKRYNKARRQVQLWQAESENAAAAHTAAQATHAEVLNRWDGERNVMMEKLEEAPTATA